MILSTLNLRLKKQIFYLDGIIRFALGKILPRNLTYRYIAALSVVATLAISGQLIIQASLVRQAIDQRRIRTLQTQIHDSENLRKAALTLQLISRKGEIKGQTDLIEFLAVRLKKNNDLFDFGKNSLDSRASGELVDAISKMDTSLANLMESCQILSTSVSSKPDYGLGNVTMDLLHHESAYRAGLWEVSRYFEGCLGLQIREFKRIELFLSFITLVVLAIEALYVFRPAVESLYEALRTRSDFLGRMGHELRNPMNSILGMSNLLAETPLTEQQKKYLSILHKSSSGLLDMLNNLLDFSSIESGEIKVEKIKFDLYKMLERSIDLAVFGAHANGIELVLDLAPDVPLRLLGDPSRLQQILANLLGNAVKFTKKGEVVLRVQLQRKINSGTEACIQFSVIDSGIGIDKKKTSQIFNAFVQEDSTVRRQFGGVGLGLAISRELVELLGGNLAVESTKNLGSRFFFTIPFIILDDFSVDHMISAENLKEFHVRLVEPNAQIFSVVDSAVRHSGGKVEKIDNKKQLEEAFAHMIAGNTLRQIMILDYESSLEALPGLFSQIRRGGVDTGHFLFLIKTTASSEDIEKLAEYGMRHFIFKPVKPFQLVKAIAEILGEGSHFPNHLLAEDSADNPLTFFDTRPLRILAVDDSKDNQFLVRAYLSTLPYRVTFADNGRLAVEKFKNNQFDVVLMDLQMPEMDGYTAVKLIRDWEKSENLKPTSVIAVSAHDHESTSDQFINAHFSSYLVKPISPTQLRQEIVKTTDHIVLKHKDENVSQAIAMKSIDDDLADLVPEYLKNRRLELGELKKLLEKGDFEMIQTLGHRLKGNAKSYGFEPLGKLGSHLEEASRIKNADEIKDIIDEIRVYLDDSKRVFR